MRAFESSGGIDRTMLSGFNTNFRYRGVLFHVQTEDSGRDNPHVITHLFHGGNILASEKRDYSELLDRADIEDDVRKLMEGQHKSMLKQLSRGEHDGVISERLGPEVFRVAAEQTQPSTVTEETFPGDLGETPSVVAEPTQLGGDPQTEEAVLEPLFATESPAAQPPAEESTVSDATRLSRVFGDRVVSEKPLDEVVLDYLVENARKRKRKPQ